MKTFLTVTLCVTLLCAAAVADDVRVIVGFKGRANADAVASLGGTDLRSLRSRAVCASVPASAVSRLRARPDVAYVEEDGIVTALAKPSSGGTTQPAQQTPWGIGTVGATGISATGLGINVAVIDTGIDLTHPDLAANIKGSVDFTGSRVGAKDENGHGTHVAGTIAAIQNTIGVVGVAPQASLWAVRVLDRRGSGFWSDVAQGIDWCAGHGINVANMSLGGGASTAVEEACRAAYADGVLLIAAAGNSGDGSTSTIETSYPAAYDSVVAVGAIDSGNNLASFSNTGPYLELCGPGVGVLSTWKGGGYATASGTSMASPHAAGVAALLWGATSTAETVRLALRSKAIDLSPSGLDSGFGYGRVHY